MRRLFLLFLFLPTIAQAQLWSGTIDPARAINWTNAGIPGGVPNRTTICSTLNSTATTANIQAAIAACPANGVVFLSAGTYNLGSGISFGGKSNVTLRGAGANQTFLNFTGAGAGGYNSVIAMEGSVSANGFENNVCDWTANYTQGATVITLANCGTTTPAKGSIANLKIGTLLILDQVDETQDTGQIWNCATQNVCANTIQGGEARTNGPGVNGTTLRSQQQGVTVTGISGNQITISPGLYMPNWRSGQLPQAWFATTTVTMDGVENLSISAQNAGQPAGGGQSIMMSNCTQCWVKGVRSQFAQRSHFRELLCAHCVIRDNYTFQNLSHQTVSYGAEMMGAWDGLIENNIFQQNTDSEPSCSGACAGNVIGYNFDINNVFTTPGWMQAGNYQHASGDVYNLWEGNIGPGYNADDVHGTHHFETVFRNYLIGNNQTLCDGATCNAQTVPVNLYAGSRYFNVIGNVLGKTGYHNVYQCNATSAASCPTGNHPGGTGSDTVIYFTGFTGNGAQQNAGVTGFCGQPACSSRGTFDPQVNAYLFRWGNYDTVNAAVQFNSSEVPSGSATFPNPVPGTHVLATSYYLNISAKPSCGTGLSFWKVNGTCPPFPPIGPDVTGGNITGVGGFANENPAMVCYLSVMLGPADGTGNVLSFNASSCYSQDASSSAPAVSLSPSSFNFGNVGKNITSNPVVVTLTNTGNASLTISSIALVDSTNFSIASATCGGSLAASASCTETITFTPTVLGNFATNLTFTTNASTSPDNVALTGIGVPTSQGATAPWVIGEARR